jgi:hypothetical protein
MSLTDDIKEILVSNYYILPTYFPIIERMMYDQNSSMVIDHNHLCVVFHNIGKKRIIRKDDRIYNPKYLLIQGLVYALSAK